MNNKVVTRFAPSPTGFMHIGGVRTAIYGWLWARKNNGTFILRIEDTDKKREVEGSIAHIIASLKWLGITWDEGVDIGGPNAPYIQSERLDTYKKYANILLEKGLAYADPYTEVEVEAFRKEATEQKKPFLYKEHRPENPPKWDGTQPLRFRNDAKKFKWNDMVRGELEAGYESLDDLILIKSDGYPTYNFAHIIDDMLMGITHIFRADEFISSTPNYLALYEALEIERPEFVTLPPILGESGTKKLGKRDGAKDILDYKREGYLPEAMLNFLALIGWNPGAGDNREVIPQKEIIESFSIDHIQKGGARFNEEKLEWFNREHIKRLTDKQFIEKAKEYIDKKTIDAKNLIPLQLDNYILLFKDRITKFGELNNLIQYGPTHSGNYLDDNITVVYGPNDFLLPGKTPLAYEAKNLIPKDLDKDAVIKHLKKAQELISENSWNEIFEKSDTNKLWIYATEQGRGKVLWPLRVALSGQMKSPDPFEIMKVIGKDVSLKRIDNAVEILNGKILSTETRNTDIGITFTE